MSVLRESPPSTRWREVTLAVAGAVVILLAVNALFAVLFAFSPQNAGSLVVREKFELAEEHQGEVDWLLVGDSSCNQGLDPASMEEATGSTFLNLCTIGDMLVVGDAWMLERWLEHHAPPRRGIAVVHAYDVWSRPASRLDGNAWTVPGTASWRLGRRPAPGGWMEVLEATMGRWSPLYMRPASVGSIVKRPWRIGRSQRREITPDGFMSVEADLENVRVDVAAHRRRLEADEPEPRFSPANLEALRILGDTASDLGVPVVLLNAPVAASLYAEPAYRERLSALQEALGATLDPVWVQRLEPLVYEDHRMQNADHLGVEAAREHSATVARLLDGVDAGVMNR